MKTYWMVMGHGRPIYRHASQESAEIEAARLARLNPGCDFVILQALKIARKSDIQWTELADDSGQSAESVPY